MAGSERLGQLGRPDWAEVPGWPERLVRSVAGAVVAVGVLMSIFYLRLDVILIVFVLSGLVAGTFRYACSEEAGWPMIRCGAMTGIVVLAAFTYALAIGHPGWSLAILGAIAGGRPLVRMIKADLAARHLAVARAAVNSPASHRDAWPSEAVPEQHEDLGAMSDRELCVAWRRSYVLLQRSELPEHRRAIAVRRQSYLDELERRQPERFARWLETGPRAASDPEKFFTRRRSDDQR